MQQKPSIANDRNDGGLRSAFLNSQGKGKAGTHGGHRVERIETIFLKHREVALEKLGSETGVSDDEQPREAMLLGKREGDEEWLTSNPRTERRVHHTRSGSPAWRAQRYAGNEFR